MFRKIAAALMAGAMMIGPAMAGERIVISNWRSCNVAPPSGREGAGPRRVNRTRMMRPTVKIFETAADVRKFEIGLFWQRSLFFWGLIAATFLAYANIKADDAKIKFAIICA